MHVVKNKVNFQPLEVVGRGSESQLQVGENYSTSFFNNSTLFCKYIYFPGLTKVA